MDPFGLEPCNFFSGLGHTVLNLLGLIPGVGDAFDIVNAGWYIAEGRWDKAFEAGIAAIPIFGNFMPDTGLFRYFKRGLNLVSYGGTGFLAGQGMWEGGQALWEEINSKNCSGWRIAGNIVGIGLNGVSLFFSGKGFIGETKALNEMLKADGVYDKLLETLKDNGGWAKIYWGKNDTVPVVNSSTKKLDSMTPEELSKLSPEQLKQALPDGWIYSCSPDGRFVHIRDGNGTYRIRIDPPDAVTTYPHIHISDENGNLLDINGNIVPSDSPDGHIPR